jgi:uncharacterized protein
LRIVLDTNVLVSGLLSPYGAPAEIVRMVASGSVRLCADARILVEYAAVLARPRFGFPSDEVEALLAHIEVEAVRVAPDPLPRRLPDADDEPFLEATIAGRAHCLVTGNLRHFPSALRAGATVLSPAEFLDYFRSHRRSD